MNFDPSKITQFLENYWYRKSGLAGALVFIGLSVGTILPMGGASGLVTTGVLVASWFVVYGLWRLSYRTPKTKKNHLGFVISIHCEDDEESRKFRADFIIPLRQLLRSSKRGSHFHFIEFPQHLASQINDVGDAEKLRTKTRAQFMLYGRVRERVLDGKAQHIIELDGIVSHKPIPDTVQRVFAREFTELLPRRVNISKENDLLSFKFTSEWAGVVSEYIIGISAAISGDLDYAEELYSGVLRKLEIQDHSFPIFAKLVDRIPTRISELYEAKAGLALQAWRDTRNQKFIDDLGEHLKKVLGKRRTEPAMLTLSALHEFVRNRDTVKALMYLKKIKVAARGSAPPNLVGAWHYNIAFLNAYDGKLHTAIRHYRKASMAIVEPDIIDQVESFLCWILEQEPDKYQFNYCLGFFNWKTKGDVVQAEKDFNKFLDSRPEGEFEKEKELVEKWVVEMRPDKN